LSVPDTSLRQKNIRQQNRKQQNVLNSPIAKKRKDKKTGHSVKKNKWKHTQPLTNRDIQEKLMRKHCMKTINFYRYEEKPFRCMFNGCKNCYKTINYLKNHLTKQHQKELEIIISKFNIPKLDALLEIMTS
jgi:hypothetical protein